MKVKSVEFESLEEVDAYLTKRLKNKEIANYQLTPYAIEPNGSRYAVSVLEVEAEDLQGGCGGYC